MTTVSLKTQRSSDDRMSSIEMELKRLDSDVEIVSKEGVILLANSFLLSKASPFLQKLLLPLLPTDNSTSARIHLPDVSKHGLSHLINILKQGFSTGISIKQEVQEAARALGFEELPVLTMSLNKEYIEEADDDYEMKIKREQYCILCQMHGHTFSEACVVNARCLDCGVKGHVRRDCKEQKSDSKNKIKKEVKREYGDIKEEKYEMKSIKGEIKREHGDFKGEKFDVEDTKLEEKCKCEEEEYIEYEPPKEEKKDNGEEIDKIENNNTQAMNIVEPAPLPSTHQEQPCTSYSPRGNKAGPAEATRKLPKRKRKVSYGSFTENSDDDCHKAQKGKKKCPKLDDENHNDYMYYYCNKCDFKSRLKGSVNRHHETVHDKIKYPCSQCEYAATQKGHLDAHVKSVHEGVKFACSECDYEATQKSGLNKHVKSVHEGVKFACSECNYEATQKGHLKAHVKSVHEGLKFACSECNYKATHKSNLKKHVKSVHEGVKFPCSKCNYEANRKSDLNRHMKSKHDSDSDDMISPKSATNSKKAKKSSAMTADFSSQPSAPTTDDPDSDSSHSRQGGKQQPKRKVIENKKVLAENDLNDSIIVIDSDEDYQPEPE